EQLSDRAIFVDAGRIRAAGTPRDGVTAYPRAMARPDTADPAHRAVSDSRDDDASVGIDALTVHTADGTAVLTAAAGEPLIARVALADGGGSRAGGGVL